MRIPQRLREPWAITPAGLHQVADLFANVEALRARDGQPLKNTYQVELRGSVAVIPVEGPLSRSLSWWAEIFGLSTYEQLRRDFQSALENPAVTAILFDVDSPGGQANGCGELATAIFNARGTKPILGYVSSYGCSAAYEIVSACDRIVIDPSAVLGSIGVRMLLVDDSKFLEAHGIKEHHLVADQSPLKVIDPAEATDRARATKMLTDMASVFVAAVARNRGVSTDKVLSDFGRGDVLVGQAAVDAGLADELGDFESVLAELAGDDQPTRSFVMATNPGQKATASMDDGECSACGRSMDDDDDIYCRACHSDASAARTALGLEAKTPAAEVIARASSLVSFERDVLAASGAKSIAEALGKIAAGVAAIAERDQLHAEIAQQKAQAQQKDFRTALDDRRLTVGHLSAMVPMFLPAAEREKAKTAIAGLASQTREGVVAALCLATASAETLEQIKAFAELQPASALPAPLREPSPNEKNVTPVVELSREQAAEMFPNAGQFGLKPEAVAKFMNVNSVADIHEAAKRKQGA